MKRIFTIACMVALCIAFTGCKNCKCCKCDKAAEEPAAVETVAPAATEECKCEGCDKNCEGCDKNCAGCEKAAEETPAK